MDIGRVAPRGGGSIRCPYCHDDIVQGPACSACGAKYHVECAQTFGACAVQACGGEVALPKATKPDALPRLAALSKRVGRWTPPPGGPRALILDLPAPKSVRDEPGPAARIVAELIGQTPYDGRMRVLSPFPEPLIRVRSEAEAARIQGRLAKAGVRSIAPSVEHLVRPFEPFEVARFEADDEKIDLVGTDGEHKTLWQAEPRLVVTSGIVVTTQQTGRLMVPTATYGPRGGRQSKRAAPAKRPKREREPCAYVFERGTPRPALFRISNLVRGGQTLGASFHAVVESLLTPNTVRRNLPEVMCSNQVFMHAIDGLGKKHSNASFVALLARLNYMCWMQGAPEGSKK